VRCSGAAAPQGDGPLPPLEPLPATTHNRFIKLKGLRKPGDRRGAMGFMDEDEKAIREQLAHLQQEHRDLDAAIAALQAAAAVDLIQIQRLKKRKLVLKDRIAFLEDQLTPDIIA